MLKPAYVTIATSLLATVACRLGLEAEESARGPQMCKSKARGQRRIIEDITVLIPTIGRPTLKACLASIASGTVVPACLIVIDQGVNPGVSHWVNDTKALGLTVLHLRSGARSPASARNLGIEYVQTSLIAAIDDDCIVEKNWLENMGNRLHKHPTAIVTGRLEPAGNGIPPTVVTSSVPRVYVKPSVRNLSPLASANMAFALCTARQIGSFDEELFAAEENDWAYRALRAGIPIVYEPEAVVYHIHWRDDSQMVATYRSYAWSQGAFYGKHLRRGDWSMILRTSVSLFRGVRSLIVGILDGDVRRRLDGYARITRLLPGLVAGLQGAGLSKMLLRDRQISSGSQL